MESDNDGYPRSKPLGNSDFIELMTTGDKFDNWI